MENQQAAVYYKDNQRRLMALDECIRKSKNKGVACKRILENLRTQGFKVSVRTFRRDVDKLHELNAPISYKKGFDALGNEVTVWYYTNLTWSLSSLKIKDNELFYLLVANRILEQYKGLPVSKHLREAFKEITESLDRKTAISSDMRIPITFAPEHAAPVDANVWNIVFRATNKGLLLKIAYMKGWTDTGMENLSVRRIEPYHIVNLLGTWYLLGTASETNKEIRQYAISRIKSAEVIDQPSKAPPTFNVQALMDVTFGQFIGDPSKATRVVVRIKKKMAHLAMERHFCATEKKVGLPNGDMELSFLTSAAGHLPFYHIKSWVLSWGADIEVVAPEELKLIVAEEVSKMASLHLAQP